MRLVFALLAVASVALARRHRRSADEEIKNSVESTSAHMFENYVRSEFDEVIHHYDENARVILPGGKVYEGIEDIEAYLKQRRQDPNYDLKSGSTAVEDVVTSGDLVGIVATSTLVYNAESGEKEVKARLILVLKKVGDDYKVIVEGWFNGVGPEANRKKRETMRERIEAAHKRVLGLMGENDVSGLQEAMTDLYAENVVYITPTGQKITGREAVGQHLTEKRAEASNIETQVDDVIEGDGMAVEIGLTKFQTDHDGHEMQHSMRHICVWKETDGKLQVAIDGMFAGDGEHVHPMRLRLRRQSDDGEDPDDADHDNGVDEDEGVDQSYVINDDDDEEEMFAF